jgi:hypothetical protein
VLRIDNSTEEVALEGRAANVKSMLFQAAAPRHPKGTRVLLVREHGQLLDATVDEHVGGVRHRILLDASEVNVDLNIFNHCASALCVSEYTQTLASHCRQLADSTAEVEDAITTRRLKVDEQLVHITAHTSRGVQREAWQQLNGLSELAPLLAAPSDRIRGERDVPPVLVRAGPGTGKTWSAQQRTGSQWTCADAATRQWCAACLSCWLCSAWLAL